MRVIVQALSCCEVPYCANSDKSSHIILDHNVLKAQFMKALLSIHGAEREFTTRQCQFIKKKERKFRSFLFKFLILFFGVGEGVDVGGGLFCTDFHVLELVGAHIKVTVCKVHAHS